MTPELVNFIGSLPLHTILLIAIIVLWRDNKRLSKQLENVRVAVASVHTLTMEQNARIYDQEATKRGAGRQPHQIPPDEPYTAMPPYRKE